MFTKKLIALLTFAAAIVLVSCTVQQGATTNTNSNPQPRTAATGSLPTPVGSPVYPAAMATDAQSGTPFTQQQQTEVEPASKISPALAQRMTSNPSNIGYDVILTEQPDFSSVNNLSNDQKATAVYNIAQDVANRTQPAISNILAELQKSGDVKEFHAFTTPNSFVIMGNAHSIDVLAKRSDIKYLEVVPRSEKVVAIFCQSEQFSVMNSAV